MSKEREAPDRLLTEAKVRRILERAARLEAGQGSLSVAELEKVAEEAGYNRAAVSKAIDEILASRDLAPSSQPIPSERAHASKPARGIFGRIPSWLRMTTSAAVGGTLGFVSRMLGTAGSNSDGADIFFVLLLGTALLFRAAHHRRRGDLTKYELEAAGIWAGFTLGWSWVHGHFWEDMLAGAGLIWLASAVVGALIILVARPTAGSDTVPRTG